jgi:hypothetical protein
MSDDEIAGLYRVPLGEFTAARNALAKARGAAGAEIRALEKPSVAAWAVNQLYWQERPLYDAVIKAALAMREAHADMISGRGGEVPRADAAHRDAIRAATVAIKRVLAAAGDSASPATLEAIADTLQALPSEDRPGHLTRPLKPLGFGALLAMGVLKSGSLPAEALPLDAGSGQPERGRRLAKAGPEVRAAAKKAAAELAAKKKVLGKQLRAAEATEAAADAALADARKALAKVERDYAATRDKLVFLEKQRSDAEQETHRRAKAQQEAANTRTQAARELGRMA